jgi:hypothetical protein
MSARPGDSLDASDSTALRHRVNFWVDQGYFVVAETPKSVRLVRTRSEDPLTAFAAKTIPGLSYAGYRDDSVEIEIDPDGQLHERLAGGALISSGWTLLQPRFIFAAIVVIVVLSWLSRNAS